MSRKTTQLEVPAEFAERFRTAFEGLSTAEIARRLGYKSQSPLTKFVQGQALPTADVLLKIAELTKINLHWLLTGEGDPSADPLSFLGLDLLGAVERLTDLREVPIEEMMRHLVRKALAARCCDLVKKHPNLEPDELLELKALMPLMSATPDKASAAISPFRRRA